MQYTVIINGKSYDLPKKSLAVTERMDETAKVDDARGLSVREKFQRVHTFVKEILGDESAKEVFGSELLDEIDLSEVTLAFRKIVDAYNKPLEDYNIQKNNEKMAAIPFAKIADMSKALEAAKALKNT